ncbi:hypothetical protein AVEN_89913-1 [Araneus ventricosus]|uniref:Uncharacterized protein n=1 Tax=Araneus ventricosus TaxID=182803 RepID=A0A4Y2UIF0_ARAVE|nr:hypothetical protein AVEN_257518-1 [Araneus ventricosus]GBO11901.1 hypothetical protein AVEN_89913-1 [Araneus ventricosus]
MMTSSIFNIFISLSTWISCCIILAADNGTSNIPKYSYYYIVPLFGIQPSAVEFSSSTSMCPKKCATPHSGSVADRTDFLANSKKSTCKKRLKVEGGSSPIRPGPHRVQRTDLPYFCGEVRNTSQSHLGLRPII